VQEPRLVIPELWYVALLFALFVVPKYLQRYHLPGAITSLGLGLAAGLGFGLFVGDPTVKLLSTFGITALFLFAGLGIDGDELRRGRRVLVQHLAIRLVLLAAGTWVTSELTGLTARPAMLVALALLTPSTGFILASLPQFGLTEQERYWVKSKAIATELLALAAMFVGLQSTTLRQLALSGAVLVAMIALLPLLFRVFAARIAPFAPKSEFAFLLMLAILCASVTVRVGGYYLVGAFVVGLAARLFRDRLPAIASDEMLHAVEVFASFFVPFYFFSAGLHVRREDLGIAPVLMGLAFFGCAVPVNIFAVLLHRRLALGERPERGMRIALPLVSTLVFTLVLAEILRDRFAAPPEIFGGLIVYTLLNTLIPGFALGAPTVAFEPPVLPEPSSEALSAVSGTANTGTVASGTANRNR
jgi:Kef-type K+ transport system membrane component KefB